MNNTQKLDELISRYSYDLLSFGSKYNHPKNKTEDASDDEKQNEERSDNSTDSKDLHENVVRQTEADENMTEIETNERETTENNGQPEILQEILPEDNEVQIEKSDSDDENEREENLFFPRKLEIEENDEVMTQNYEFTAESENPKENTENYAFFTARIFAAEGALPVQGAKVVVKKNGEIHLFLVTNGSGETKTVKLEAYPEQNSLEPLNPNKQMEYTADVYADGFESKKDLLVEATGGSEIILQEFMVPVDSVIS